MAIWFQIALVLNLVYWAVFFYLLSRRRWNVPALAVGIFHMLFAAVISVAPIRSLLDPDYIGYGLGEIQLEKRAVVIPAALILAWALSSAWIAVGKGRGRWMRVIMVGDLFFALSMAVSILLDDSQDWTFQLGEHFKVSGVVGLVILLGFFTLPFVVSAVWAATRTRAGGTATPSTPNEEEKPGDSSRDDKNTNGFQYADNLI